MLDRLKQLPPVASAMILKPRKVVTAKKKSRNLIKAEQKALILVTNTSLFIFTLENLNLQSISFVAFTSYPIIMFLPSQEIPGV